MISITYFYIGNLTKS